VTVSVMGGCRVFGGRDSGGGEESYRENLSEKKIFKTNAVRTKDSSRFIM